MLLRLLELKILYLEKLIDSIMKSFKGINVSSDGSFYFHYHTEILSDTKQIIFQKQDAINFSFNQKKVKKNLKSKHSSYYKKKYLK